MALEPWDAGMALLCAAQVSFQLEQVIKPLLWMRLKILAFTLDGGGSVDCWGVNSGCNPGRVPDGSGYTAIAAGSAGTLTLDNTGTAHCWGDGCASTPTATGFTAIAASGTNLLALNAAPLIQPSSYNFIGFLDPVDNTMVNTGKAGRTYPIKWQLTDSSGNFIPDLGTFKSLTYQKIACGTLASELTDALETAVPTGDTSVRYDSTTNQFIYNWTTPKDATLPACYTLSLTLDSGPVHTADFKFSK
jgi:hypothetical protein